MDTESPLIFVSYTTKDREDVIPYYEHLASRGIDAWMDFRRIKPGQNWDFEIKRALNKASVILLFVSSNSVNRRGYAQREIKIALERLEEKLIDDIYLIPVLLDDNASIPEELKDVQFTRASSENCKEEIEDAIRHQLKQLGQNTQLAQDLSNVQWSKSKYKDMWDGIPGVEIEIQVLHLRSAEYAKAAEITEYVKGYFYGEAMGFRETILDPSPDIYNFGQERQRRTNTFDAHCSEPHITGKMISINYAVHTYYAGAAHPNMSFKTFCFMLDPLIQIRHVRQLFINEDDALKIIQDECRRDLKKPRETIDGNEEIEYEFDSGWIQQGTETWDHFSSYLLKENCIEFLFDPYQVASYADGPQFAEVEYSKIWKLMHKHYLSALGQDYMHFRFRAAVDPSNGPDTTAGV